MLESIPKRTFFTFEFPIHHIGRVPSIDGDTTKWKAKYEVPPLHNIDDESGFADVWLAWNEDYFFAAFDVEATRRPQVDLSQWWKLDGLRLCLDTRNLRRASRFSYFFYMLPVGGGANKKQPVIGMHKLNKAKEAPAKIDLAQIKIAADVNSDGYGLEMAIPTRLLAGWDPVEHPRIGIFYKIKGQLEGSQHLTVTDDFGWNSDPGVWATGVLSK